VKTDLFLIGPKSEVPWTTPLTDYRLCWLDQRIRDDQ